MGTRKYIGVHWRFNFNDFFTKGASTAVEKLLNGKQINGSFCSNRLPPTICQKLLIASKSSKYTMELLTRHIRGNLP